MCVKEKMVTKNVVKGLVWAVLFCFLFSSASFASSEGAFKKIAHYVINSPVLDAGAGAYEIYKAPKKEKLKASGKVVAEYSFDKGVEIVVAARAVPVAVQVASAAGMTASTGTAISALSGAAATSATLAAIGGSASTALAAIGIAMAPAVVGGAIVTGAALGFVSVTKWLISR